MTTLHLGSLHPVEQALTIVLAFGPFLLLGIVILVRRRQEATEEAAAAGARDEAAPGDGDGLGDGV